LTLRTGSGINEPARPSNLRVQNSRTLLGLVRDHEPCSKADLARLSGLSAPTVAAAVAELSERGLLEVVGEGPSSGGRPPELLRFRPEHRFVAAADIGGTRLRMMVADLNGTPVAECKCVIAPDAKRPEDICVLLREQLLSACASAGIPFDKILHLTVGAPGITDVRLYGVELELGTYGMHIEGPQASVAAAPAQGQNLAQLANVLIAAASALQKMLQLLGL